MSNWRFETEIHLEKNVRGQKFHFFRTDGNLVVQIKAISSTCQNHKLLSLHIPKCIFCSGDSDRLRLGWTNRQPNTWAWHVRCRTQFTICCCWTGGARPHIVVQAYFVRINWETKYFQGFKDENRTSWYTKASFESKCQIWSWWKLSSKRLTYFFARNNGFESASVSFSYVFLSNLNCLSGNLVTSFLGL